jgi:F-type H+-transporting ATPase subunit delta
MGILSQHVPSITQLRPGVVEIISEGNTGDKWFGMPPSSGNCLICGGVSWTMANGGVVSGGFATVQPGNLLSINAVEAYTLEDFAPEAIRSGLAEAQRVAGGGGSEEDVAEAKIEVEVLEALQVPTPPKCMDVNVVGCWSQMIENSRIDAIQTPDYLFDCLEGLLW